MGKSKFKRSNDSKQITCSRRKLLLSAAMLSCINLSKVKPGHASDQNLKVAIDSFGLGESRARLGEWMRLNLSSRETHQLITKAVQQIDLTSTFSESSLRKLISQDYIKGRTINISSIMFSIIEAALCLSAANTLNKKAGANDTRNIY